MCLNFPDSGRLSRRLRSTLVDVVALLLGFGLAAVTRSAGAECRGAAALPSPGLVELT